MSFSEGVLKRGERAIYDLRALYEDHGYSLYKVNKFEEYDLYANNKSFLVSSNILTFTDTNGKLLALKPDVTLSIVKNISDGDTSTHKFCYNETVYRTSADSDGFREIVQTGLECIGNIDLYSECEVIYLALKSLETVSRDHLLDISHMGFIDGLLSEACIKDADKGAFLDAVKSKNVHALTALCQRLGVSSDMEERLCVLANMYLPIEDALVSLKNIIVGEKMLDAYNELKAISNALVKMGSADRIYVDFSVVNDVNYYDGVCFKGFIKGIPDSVLSGGRYDRLLERLGKAVGAIGFAVYLDRLERFESDGDRYDVDAVIIYDDDTDISELIKAQKELADKGMSVLVSTAPDKTLRIRSIYTLTEGGLKVCEGND